MTREVTALVIPERVLFTIEDCLRPSHTATSSAHETRHIGSRFRFSSDYQPSQRF